MKFDSLLIFEVVRECMKKIGHFVLVSTTVLFFLQIQAFCQEERSFPTDNFYSKSLHYTNKGIEFIYSKENGGLELLTGMTADELGCMKAKCHVKSCDVCHLKEINGKPIYSADPEITQSTCPECHGDLAKDNPDVHFANGMRCMDCHSKREVHGDGVDHNTYMEPGFFDTRCENCHSDISKSMSHTVHGNKLDCAVCHTARYTTCLNCHIGARLEAKKDVQIRLENMFFLINHDGKVTLGNMLSYVFGNKTMITFAPAYSHSIKKEGRICEECHDSKIVRGIKTDKFEPVRWEKNRMINIEGVIPVLDGMKWDLVFLDRKDTMWIPLKNPTEPILSYSGYCSPITDEQFKKIEKKQTIK